MQKTQRIPVLAFLGALAVSASIGWGIQRSSAEQDVERDEHGAAVTEAQEQILARLLEGVDPMAVPYGIDADAWERSIPEDNALTPERIELGRRLYFDKRLSRDGTVSCATCHDVTRGLTDQRKVSEGIGGQEGKRNAPTTANAMLLQTVFLDGRSPNVEHQARMPIVNPIEMGMPDGEAAAAAIQGDPEMEAMFQAAYGRSVNYEDIGRAIGAFERTLTFLRSPFQRFLAGEAGAISEEAQAGWALYNGTARCVTCHPINGSNPVGSDNRFHNIGVSARTQNFEALAKKALAALAVEDSEQRLDELAIGTDLSELGRFMVTRNYADIGAFRTSQILNVGITAPYMHDGSMDTLWDVMDHYNKGGEDNPYLDGGIEALALTEQEIDQLVAFMFTLTDERFAEDNARELERQRSVAAENRPFRDTALANREKVGFEARVMESD